MYIYCIYLRYNIYNLLRIIYAEKMKNVLKIFLLFVTIPNFGAHGEAIKTTFGKANLFKIPIDYFDRMCAPRRSDEKTHVNIFSYLLNDILCKMGKSRVDM